VSVNHVKVNEDRTYAVNEEELPPPPGGARTLPQLLLHQASTQPDGVAMRQKEFGRWSSMTFAQLHRRTAAVGLGLRELGVGPGDVVAIHSENRPEWVLADLGAQGIGAICTGIYETSPPAEVEYLLGHSQAKVVVVEDQRQFDKTWEVKDRLPDLARIVVMDTRGIRDLDHEMVITFEELEQLGARHAVEDFDAAVAQAQDDDCAIIVYTSGTTGAPKGAMISHRNLLTTAAATSRPFASGPGDELLSYLPLCHIAERLFTVISGMYSGYTVNFGEAQTELIVHLREIQPTILLGVPRVWERMLAGIQIRMKDASRLKRLSFGLAQKLGAWKLHTEQRSGPGPLTRLAGGVAWLIAFRSLRYKFGLGRVRGAFSGAAPIAREVLEFFAVMGVPIREGYGMTENTAAATFSPADDVRVGKVGQPLPGVELAIAPDGEILTRSPANFLGYFKNPEATAQTLADDGWLHTGDVGVLDEDGFLSITDRKKDIIITAGGKNISPSEIENKLKVSPWIREAVVIGDERKYLVALIGVESETVGDWATRRSIPYTTYQDLSDRPEVRELIQQVVDDVNADLAQVETIKYFEFLTKELDPEDGDVTATQKVKRRAIEQQYADEIESMYRARAS